MPHSKFLSRTNQTLSFLISIFQIPAESVVELPESCFTEAPQHLHGTCIELARNLHGTCTARPQQHKPQKSTPSWISCSCIEIVGQIRNGLEYNSYTMNLDLIFNGRNVFFNIYDDLPLKMMKFMQKICVDFVTFKKCFFIFLVF